MRTRRKKVEDGIRMAAAAVKEAGTRATQAARKLAVVGDDALVKLGDAARRRKRARAGKSVLKTVGTAALVTGVVVAGRTAMKKR
jgi:hypothetical protein